MSDEEKKAIDIVENIKFKKYCVYLAKEMRDEIRFYQTEEERKAIDIVLNIIEKLQKEIEELKQNRDEYKEEYKKLLDARYYNYISKDKIREKIKELETLYNCNLDTALTSYEMFVFVRSYIDKVKNILKELEEN